MLILSNSMCKSASTITWWYKSELINRTCSANGNRGVADFINSGAVRGQGRFVEDPVEDQALDRLMEFANVHGPTVVKTHCHMTPYLDRMIRERKIIATYNHRDPRDVILSAFDCRNRELENGSVPRFSQFSSIEAGIPLIREQCVRSEPWIVHPRVHNFLYREIVADPEKQIRSLATALEVEVSDTLVKEILEIEARNKSGHGNWMEFNEAKLARYHDEMTSDQIKLCNETLGPWIEKFGYQIDKPPMTPPGVALTETTDLTKRVA
jgi:hypothetical protein